MSFIIESGKSISLEQLPENAWNIIDSNLAAKERSRLAQSCSALHHIMNKDEMWKARLNNEFGIAPLSDNNSGKNSPKDIYKKCFLIASRMKQLPQDLWNIIDSSLSAKENGCLALVSKAFHRIMNNHGMWRARLAREFCSHIAAYGNSNGSHAKDLYKELHNPPPRKSIAEREEEIRQINDEKWRNKIDYDPWGHI